MFHLYISSCLEQTGRAGQGGRVAESPMFGALQHGLRGNACAHGTHRVARHETAPIGPRPAHRRRRRQPSRQRARRIEGLCGTWRAFWNHSSPQPDSVHPVFQPQHRHPGKLPDIVGNQYTIQCQRVSGNQHIKRTNRRSQSFQTRSQTSIMARCFVIKRQHFQRSKKFLQCRPVSFGTAFRSTIIQLGNRYGRNSNIPKRKTIKTKHHFRRPAVDYIYADIRIQQIASAAHLNSSSRSC